MLTVELEEDIFSYEGPKNVIVLPITGFVRKDGNLVATNTITKKFFEKYHSLAKKWGYMINNDVIYPSFVSSETNLLGIVEKPHYAGAYRPEAIFNGFWYVKELALIRPDHIYYIIHMGSDAEEDQAREIFENLETIVYIKGEPDE